MLYIVTRNKYCLRAFSSAKEALDYKQAQMTFFHDHCCCCEACNVHKLDHDRHNYADDYNIIEWSTELNKYYLEDNEKYIFICL